MAGMLSSLRFASLHLGAVWSRQMAPSNVFRSQGHGPNLLVSCMLHNQLGIIKPTNFVLLPMGGSIKPALCIRRSSLLSCFKNCSAAGLIVAKSARSITSGSNRPSEFGRAIRIFLIASFARCVDRTAKYTEPFFE